MFSCLIVVLGKMLEKNPITCLEGTRLTPEPNPSYIHGRENRSLKLKKIPKRHYVLQNSQRRREKKTVPSKLILFSLKKLKNISCVTKFPQERKRKKMVPSNLIFRLIPIGKVFESCLSQTSLVEQKIQN